MTSKNKTGEKLVASIRKSKAGAAAHKVSESETKTAAPVKSTDGDKSSVAVSNEPTAKQESAASTTVPERQDGYSCGGRVWPD